MIVRLPTRPEREPVAPFEEFAASFIVNQT